MIKIDKKKSVFILIIILIVFIYLLFIKSNKNNAENDFIVNINDENQLDNNLNNTEEINKNRIVVYITGAVNNSGVYEIEEYSRISDIIEIAGGLTDNAFIDNINLAYMLEDGMKIHIPTKEENIDKTEDNTNDYIMNNKNITNSDTNKNINSKININIANQTELETLPGIGSSIALKIIEYRNKNGKFKSIDDIKNVSGIGNSKFEKIKDLIKV